MTITKNKKNILSGISSRYPGAPYKFFVGIDPDVEKSGLAIYEKATKKLTRITALSFWDLHKQLPVIFNRPDAGVIHIEGGWLVEKSNFHTSELKGFHTIKESRVAQRIAKNVGNNHAAGRAIVEMLIELDLNFVVRPPINPLFKNEDLFKKVTGWVGRTNYDMRSAANYVFGF